MKRRLTRGRSSSAGGLSLPVAAMGNVVMVDCLEPSEEGRVEKPNALTILDAETATANANQGADALLESPVNGSPSRNSTTCSRRLSTPRNKKKLHQKITRVVQSLWKNVEDFLFPPMIPLTDLSKNNSSCKARKMVFLYGCDSLEQHYATMKLAIESAKGLRGEEGLRALGLEYRMLPCENHTRTPTTDNDSQEDNALCKSESHVQTKPDYDPLEMSHSHIKDEHKNIISPERDMTIQAQPDNSFDIQSSTALPSDLISEKITHVCSMQAFPHSASIQSVCSDDFLNEAALLLDEPDSDFDASSNLAPKCMQCMRRLYHIASNSLVTVDNRKSFVADGDMYEAAARLCQEYVHDSMCQEFQLEWVTIESYDDNGCDNGNAVTMDKEPLRALINSSHPCLHHHPENHSEENDMLHRPTVFIATGRGKVRAGIFSREHLIGTGMESATAIPILREAMRRKMNVIVVDHNVHGDVQGFITFEKTLDYVASLLHGETVGDFINKSGRKVPDPALDLYVVSHSASGGHLARYLLETQHHYLPHIRAIAFTDSTHNIQWSMKQDKPGVTELLESDKCVYFRSSKAREQDDTTLWYLHRSGEPIQTDHFWQHRFGKIRTFWAGTNEHSLTNWYAHTKIWQHFDDFLGTSSGPHENETCRQQKVISQADGVNQAEYDATGSVDVLDPIAQSNVALL